MNNDWKPTENNISSPWDVNVQENNIGQPTPQTPKQVSEMSYDKRFDWDALSEMNIQPIVKYICTCDFFGGGQFCIHFTEKNIIPNRWIRFWTRVFFNSKWEFLND